MKKNRNIRQGNELHSSDSMAGPRPLQFFPPFLGSGLLQDRLRIFTPRPQETLHPENLLQSE